VDTCIQIAEKIKQRIILKNAFLSGAF